MRDDRHAEAGLSQMRSPASARQFADVLLGQAGFQQRSSDAVLPRGLLAGTVVALVVRVHAIGDDIEARSASETPPSQ